MEAISLPPQSVFLFFFFFFLPFCVLGVFAVEVVVGCAGFAVEGVVGFAAGCAVGCAA